MPHYRVAHAFRWRPTMQPCVASDFVRVHEADNTLLVALANGHECGWSACWSAGSALLLDLFMNSWGRAAGETGTRLLAALDDARETFPGRAKMLVPDDPDDLVGGPGGTLLVVAVRDVHYRAAWIGPDSAFLIRNFSIAQQTTPHTLREKARGEGMSEEDVMKLPNVVIGSISEAVGSDVSIGRLESTAPLGAGDWLVLANDDVLRVLSREDLAYFASTHASPQVVADELVRLAFENSDIPYAAVVAVRSDDIPVADSIRSLIDSYEPDPRHATWLREYSRKHEALPVAFDMGGAYCVRPDGSVVSVGWEDSSKPPSLETGDRSNLWALASAARRYPILNTLRPAAPTNAVSCPRCEQDTEGEGCAFCCYQGWVVPSPSALLRGLMKRPAARADAEGPQKGPPRAWWQFWKRPSTTGRG